MDRIDREVAELAVWVVYDSPVDIPGRFVARKWLGGRPTLVIMQAVTLDELRAKLPAGLSRFVRHVVDDAKIVECWM